MFTEVKYMPRPKGLTLTFIDLSARVLAFAKSRGPVVSHWKIRQRYGLRGIACADAMVQRGQLDHVEVEGATRIGYRLKT
jgi:hypothetical protein